MPPLQPTSHALPPAGLRRAALASLCLAACLQGAPVLAQSINVSGLVTGTMQLTPLPSTAPTLPCGSACGYASVSAASFVDGYLPSVGGGTVSTWPPVLAAHSQLPAPGSLLRSGTIAPADPGLILNTPTSFGIGQQALARFTASAGASEPNELSVQTWRSGTGSAVVSYGIRLVTPSTGSRQTYLQFKLPESQLSGMSASKVLSNFTNEYKRPVQVLSRAAMDVYVDGLPVWSSESNLLMPKRYPNGDVAQLPQQWGPAFGTGSVTLYLGELPAGSTRAVALVLRSDQRVEAPGCLNDYMADPDQQRCHSQKTSLSLPMTTTAGPYLQYVPDVRIFTK